MNGNKQKEISQSNPSEQTVDVDSGPSFQLLELRKTVKGAFGNGVAQLQLRKSQEICTRDTDLSNSLSERDQSFPDRRGCRNSREQMIQKGALRIDYSH